MKKAMKKNKPLKAIKMVEKIYVLSYSLVWLLLALDLSYLI